MRAMRLPELAHLDGGPLELSIRSEHDLCCPSDTYTRSMPAGLLAGIRRL
jgi:hypothetical protein